MLNKSTNKNALENILSSEELDTIITEYQQGKSIRDICQTHHRSRQSVSQMLTRLGIKTTVGNHYRYYHFNENFFEKIDNELSAYWLGFLYADGCILTPKTGQQEFKLCLAEQDREVIEHFQTDLESTYPIREDVSKHLNNPNCQIQVIQSLRSQKAVNDLKRLGCTERKSLTLTFPTREQVPPHLLHHFIRGYFDGDGSISFYSNDYHISIVGTENFIKSLYSVIQMGSIFSDKRKTNSWYLHINGNLQVLKFYHFLYDGATRFMKRKYDKFQTLIMKYGESQGI